MRTYKSVCHSWNSKKISLLSWYFDQFITFCAIYSFAHNKHSIFYQMRIILYHFYSRYLPISVRIYLLVLCLCPSETFFHGFLPISIRNRLFFLFPLMSVGDSFIDNSIGFLVLSIKTSLDAREFNIFSPLFYRLRQCS